MAAAAADAAGGGGRVVAAAAAAAAPPRDALIAALQAAPDWGADAVVNALVAYVADRGVAAAAVGGDVYDAYWALR